MKKDAIKGGKADKLSLQQIADKFKVPIDKLKKQIEMGIKVEMEHTDDKEKATEIATDHISEFPDYYDRLSKMEKKASKDWKGSEVTENTKKLIKRLIREAINFLVFSVTSKPFQSLEAFFSILDNLS